MSTPGESKPGTGENLPMASDAEKDNLILHAGELFQRAFDGYKAAMEEPDEPMPGILGVTPTADELAQHPTLQRWDTADIQYAAPRVNEDLPIGNPDRVHPARLMATFSLSGTNHMEAISLTPSFVEEDPIDQEERNRLQLNVTEDIPQAEIQDIGALLTATIGADPNRLDFPGLPPEA